MGTKQKLYLLDQDDKNITSAVYIVEPERIKHQDHIKQDSKIASSVDKILEDAIKDGAESVHLDPRDSYLSIKFRINGGLKEINKLPGKYIEPIAERLKLLSELDVNNNISPQHGEVTIRFDDKDVLLKVSSFPTISGEKVTIKIENNKSTNNSLVSLGLWGQNLKDLSHAINEPYGFILISGTDISGASTLLQTLLVKLSSTLRVTSVESPLDYSIGGSAVHSSINIYKSIELTDEISALMREGSDVISIGSISDPKTAMIAMDSAIDQKKLILASIKASNSVDGLAKLRNMGIEPYIINSITRASVSTRLARKLCDDCKIKFKPSEPYIKQLENYFNIKSESDLSYIDSLETIAAGDGLIKQMPDKSIKNNKIHHLYKENINGCRGCHGTGYSGNIGLFEVYTIPDKKTDKSSSYMYLSDNLSSGFISLKLDGLVKSLLGITTISEVVGAVKN